MIRTLEECRTLAVSTAPIGTEIWFGILPAVLPQANFRCASSAEKQMSTEPNQFYNIKIVLPKMFSRNVRAIVD